MRGKLVVGAVALALLAGGGASLYAVTSNKDADTVTCDQILKLRAANLKGIDIFEAAVQAGWEDEPPTQRERATANKFFDDQRDALLSVHCP